MNNNYRKAAQTSAAVLAAVALGSVVGQFDLGRPRQLLRAPYVEQVPVGLLAAFLVLGVLGVGVAVALHTRLVPGRLGWRGPALAIVVSAGAVASGWGGLYSAAVENPIPIFDWAFYAAPVALAGLLTRGTAVSPLAPGVLAAVPVGALNSLGWAVSSGLSGALTMTVFSGGIGLAVGLGLGHALGGPAGRPARGWPPE